ncbi:MAG: T9SS type A sorting domain-containing protein [Candidatus Marinimicrobia bacterium]|nr:T9SS type A sorting domain-containing protein [Candidatus Neomarinimicrobiota bacterium]
MLKTLRNMMVGMSILLMAVFVSGATITIDGDMSDWTPAMQVDVEPGPVEETGDQAIVEIDIKDVYMTNDADYIYIRCDFNEDGVLGDLESVSGKPQIFLDTDMSNETGLTWGYMAAGVDVWIEFPLTNQDSINFTEDAGGTWSLIECATMSAINAEDNAYELAISRADLGLDDAPGFRLMILNEETASWGNDAFPNDLGTTTMDYYFSSPKTIDGDMSDWSSFEMLDKGGNAEETGDFDYPSLDLKDIYMAYDDEYVYVRIDINEDGVFSDIPDVANGIGGVLQCFFDTDVSAETGLTWEWWATGCDWWLHPLNMTDTLLMHLGDDPNGEDYDMVGNGYASAINGDDNAVEFAVPRADLGEVGTFYESLNFMALCEEMENWSADEFPNAVGDTTALFTFGAGGVNRGQPVAIDVELDSNLPTEFAVVGNYPNPFNPSTTIRFTLSDASNVTLDVYNMLGQKVASLYNGLGHSGANEVTWNGTNDNNQSVDSGVYVYRVTTPSGVASGKMIMLK